MTRPKPPAFKFNVAPPTLSDFQRSAKRKRNKAAPGFNALPYVVYKKCVAILKLYVVIANKIWVERSIPQEWAIAYMILLSKSDVLDLPTEFRPIALTNCDGKLFFSVIAERMESFMVRNNFIDRKVQKGFLAGIPGCSALPCFGRL